MEKIKQIPAKDNVESYKNLSTTQNQDNNVLYYYYFNDIHVLKFYADQIDCKFVGTKIIWFHDYFRMLTT